MQKYAVSIFILDEADLIMRAASGENISKEDIDENTLEALFLKYETLRIPIRRFYDESQRDIDSNVENYKTQEVEYADGTSDRQMVVVDMGSFVRDLKLVWKKEYQKYFDEQLPNYNNDLRQDVLFVNKIYNPIFMSYRLKDLAMKAEYAYMYYLSQVDPKINLNFGIAFRKEDSPEEIIKQNREILIASDGGLNFPNRLHIKGNAYIDFIKAYTGSPLIRLYEGREDFELF